MTRRHPDANCADWTDPDAGAFLVEGANGLGLSVDANAFGTSSSYGRGYCSTEHRVFCVEQ